MAKYVDGFVFLVPKKNLVAYKKMAKEGAAAWKKFGALEYFECKGDDLKQKKAVGMPVQMSFTTMAKAGSGDTVWFSFIVFKNKAHRDSVNKKVMAFFAKKYADKKEMTMPFDITKMAYGGFSVEVEG